MIKTRLNTRGVIALQTVIIIAVLALGAAGGGIIIYNVVADKTEDLAITDDVVEKFTSTKKEKLDVLLDPNNNTPGANLGPEATARPEELEDDEEEDNEDDETEDDELEEEVIQVNNEQEETESGQGEEGATEVRLPQISASSRHTCVIRGTERQVWCWGSNRYGELGNGESGGDTAINVGSSTAIQAIVLEETNVQSVSAGHQFSCALLMDKTIKCWGQNQHGQLGVGTAGGISIIPVQVVGITNAISIIAGRVHTCAVLKDKTAKCWGNNNYGQLGNGVRGGADEYFPTPMTVGGSIPLGNIVSITPGREHTCALLEDKTARCWGNNQRGQLGNGGVNTAPIPNPVTVLESAGGEALGDIKSISVGSNYTCALLEDKTAKCWGSNAQGQLGSDGTSQRRTIPVPVIDTDTAAPLANIMSISLGTHHTCALLEDKTAYCWGNNRQRQLGNGAEDDGLFSPLPVLESTGARQQFQPLANIMSIAAGENHTCALLEDETTRCWGAQKYGQLGNGLQNLNVSRYPVPVLGF